MTNPRGWQHLLIAPARDLEGRSTQVAVGLVMTAAGRRLAVRVGGQGDPALLPLQAAIEHHTHVQQLVTELRRGS